MAAVVGDADQLRGGVIGVDRGDAVGQGERGAAAVGIVVEADGVAALGDGLEAAGVVEFVADRRGLAETVIFWRRSSLS